MSAPAWPITVPVESCCGVLVGEVHDCPQFAAEAMAAFATPILLRPHSSVPCLTDPALTGDRLDWDLVQRMDSPLRWGVTEDTVSVEAGP